MKPDLLTGVLEVAGQARISIEYVETNCAWYRDEASACGILERLRANGVDSLLVSISPFHAETIPFEKTLGVMAACKKTGIHVFPWMETFMADLAKLDRKKPHKMEAFTARFGSGYLADIPRRYWIHLGGRALDTFRPVYETKPLAQIISENPGSCAARLCDTSHFHVDLYGKYIPGLCAGLALDYEHIGKPLPKERYPLLTLLLEKGITGLFDMARVKGFSPDRPGYISKCDLCTDIRCFFALQNKFNTELLPRGFYGE